MAFFLKCSVTENNTRLSEIGHVICFQTQSFVSPKLCSKTLPIPFPSSFFLHPSRFRKNPHAAIVLAAAGYLPSGSTFIYGRDSFFFVILYCKRAHVQETLHTIHIQFLMLRGPHPRTRRNFRGSLAHPGLPLVLPQIPPCPHFKGGQGPHSVWGECCLLLCSLRVESRDFTLLVWVSSLCSLLTCAIIYIPLWE